MVRHRRHILQYCLIQFQHSRIHEVHARPIWALSVITVPLVDLIHNLTHSSPAAGSLRCPLILIGSSYPEKRSFVGPWCVLWELATRRVLS